MSHRDKKLLYHLTEIANLPGILEHGLLPRAALRELGGPARDVADHEILDGRRLHGLEEMVPFHFLSRGPFDYAAVRNNPNGRFLLLTVWRSLAIDRGWTIVPRHPLVAHERPEVLAWQEGFNRIDWEQMDRKDRDYINDAECRHACMAEALSPGPVTVADLAFIFVATEETRALVDPQVNVKVSVNGGMFPGGCR